MPYSRKKWPYSYTRRKNSEIYQQLDGKMVPAVQIDTDFNYIIDSLNNLEEEIGLVVAGNLPGSNLIENANKVYITNGAGDIYPSFIGNENLRRNCINSDNISDFSVTSEKYEYKSIEGDKVNDGAISDVHISSVDGSKILPNTIIGSMILNESIDSIKITSIDGSKIQNETISNEKYSPGSISSSKISDVNGEKIDDRSIEFVKLTRVSSPLPVAHFALSAEEGVVDINYTFNCVVTSVSLEGNFPKTMTIEYSLIDQTAERKMFSRQLNFIPHDECTVELTINDMDTFTVVVSSRLGSSAYPTFTLVSDLYAY